MIVTVNRKKPLPSEPFEGLAVCRAKAEPLYVSYFKTLRIGSGPRRSNTWPLALQPITVATKIALSRFKVTVVLKFPLQCSRTCGKGIKRRAVGCFSMTTRKQITDEACEPKLRPATQLECTIKSCIPEARWRKGSWGKVRIFSNYWMRLSRMWRIMQFEVDNILLIGKPNLIVVLLFIQNVSKFWKRLRPLPSNLWPISRHGFMI